MLCVVHVLPAIEFTERHLCALVVWAFDRSAEILAAFFESLCMELTCSFECY